jgi:hypothetical protein
VQVEDAVDPAAAMPVEGSAQNVETDEDVAMEAAGSDVPGENFQDVGTPPARVTSKRREGY